MSKEDEKKLQLHDSPYIGGLKMSSSLKERLKRSSRSFSSPLSKSAEFQLSLKDKSCLDIGECSSPQNVESPIDTISFSQDDIEACSDQDLLQQMYLNLKKQISENEEKLRKLKLVEHYHMKNKPDELVLLIKKWLTASQHSLRKLYEKLPENKSDFQEFLNVLNIDNNLIRYDHNSDAFY